MKKFSLKERNQTIEKLEEKIRFGGRGCRVWQGAVDRDGYGVTQFREPRLHELVFQIFRGTPPERMVFRHQCGNKNCCNLMHLALVSPYCQALDEQGDTYISAVDAFIARLGGGLFLGLHGNN